MPGRGRRPLVRNVYSFEQPGLLVPAEVYLDTSFVVNLLVRTEAHHQGCQAFMLQLVDAESVVCFSRILELELAEAAFKIAVIEQHGKKAWPSKRNDGRVRRRAGRLTDQLFGSWNDLLRTVPYLAVDLAEVAANVPDLMRRYGLASMDAAHVATAEYVGVDGLVTTDAGFAAIPATRLRLYVDDTRVRSCRRRRGGR